MTRNKPGSVDQIIREHSLFEEHILKERFTMSEVETKIENNVATIYLNRPQRGNSITSVMRDELKIQFAQLEENKDVYVIVLTGRGTYFCTGMDLNMNSPQDASPPGESTIQLFDAIRNSRKPTIAKINGPVMGGGCGFAFACDIRIAVSNSWFAFSEVKRGLIPAIISPICAPHMGKSLATEFMMTGMRVPAQRYYELGLISAVAKDDVELDHITQNYINELLSSAPLATQDAKALVDYVTSHSSEENRAAVQQAFVKMLNSSEAQYGISQFLSKQTPNWHQFHSKL